MKTAYWRVEAIKKIVVHYCHGPKQNDDDFPMIMEAKWEMYKCLRFLLNCEKQDLWTLNAKLKENGKLSIVSVLVCVMLCIVIFNLLGKIW